MSTIRSVSFSSKVRVKLFRHYPHEKEVLAHLREEAEVFRKEEAVRERGQKRKQHFENPTPSSVKRLLIKTSNFCPAATPQPLDLAMIDDDEPTAEDLFSGMWSPTK